MSEFWKHNLLSVRSWRSFPVRVSVCVSDHRPSQIFSLLCHWMQSEHRKLYLDYKSTIFNKIIGHITVTPVVTPVAGEFFLSLSCQYPGNFVPTNQPHLQKKFRMDCVYPYQWIFQTQRRHRGDWQTNYMGKHLAPLLVKTKLKVPWQL